MVIVGNWERCSTATGEYVVGESKVSQYCLSCVVYEHVARFDVAVNKPNRVNVVEPIKHAQAETYNFTHRQILLADEFRYGPF